MEKFARQHEGNFQNFTGHVPPSHATISFPPVSLDLHLPTYGLDTDYHM